MAIEVEGPDGTIIEFPDGTAPDVMKGAMAKRYKPPATTAETVGDVAMQVPAGVNRGWVGLMTAPWRAIDWAGEKLTGTGFLPDAEKMPLYRPYIGDQSPKPQTEAGRYAGAAGEAVGASVIPSAALLGNAQRLAALAPTTAPRAVAQQIGEQIATRPGAAVAADAVSAIGSGIGQQVAAEEGFGHAGQTMGALAGGFAPLAVGQGVAHLTQSARGALARSDPHARVASGLGDSSVDELSSRVATGATRFDEATNRRTLDVLGQEMVRANGDRAAAQQATIARMVAEDGITPGTAMQRVRHLTEVHRDSDLMFGEYPAVAAGDQATRRMRPANVTDEAAARVDDVGTHWEIDNIANAGSGTSGQRVRNAVTQRAEDLADTTRQVVQRMAPNGHTIQDTENLIQGLTRQARGEYDAVHNTPGQPDVNYGILHGLLARVVARHRQRMFGRAGEQRDALESAINEFFVDTPHGRLLLPDSQMFQDMRGVVRGMIERNRRAGNDHIVNTLQPLYRDMTRIMERASPRWAQVNRRWADMRLDEVAQDLGDALSKTAGPRFREQMAEYRRLAPEAQNIVRIHFVQKMLDQIDNAVKLGKMRDLGAQFSTDHMRATVRAVLGDGAAVQLARLIRDHNVAAKSGKMIGGSPTHMRAMRQGDKDQDLGILASIDQASVSGFRKWAMDWTINRLRERRNREVGRIVTTPMSDTAGVAEHLERMRGAAARAQRLSEPVRIPSGLGGKIGGVSAEGDGQQPQNALMSPPQGRYIPNAGELDRPIPEPQEAPQQDMGQSAMPFEGGDLPQGSVDWQNGRRFARDVGGFAAEMTGVPSVIRGAGDIGKGYSEGDPLRAAAGVGQAALGLMPAAGIVGRGLMTAGKAGAAAVGSMLPMAAADVRDARAGADEKVRSAVEGDQTVQRLRTRLEELRGKQQSILSTPIKGLNRASADAAREKMAGPLNEEIATLVGTPDKPGLIKQAEDAAAKGYLDNAPFRERYPGTAEALLYGGAGLAAAIPMANTMRHRFADRFAYQPQLEAQAGRVENALRGSTTQPNALQRAMGTQAETIAPNQGVFEAERATMRNMLASRDAREPSHLGQYAAGAAIMQEARMIPEEVDAIVFPHGHPAREAATNALLDPSYYAKGAIPSILGGASMAHLGNKAGNMLSPRAADVERAVAAAGLRWKGEARPEVSRMDRIKDAATRRAESWLEPPARSPSAPASGIPSSPAGAPPAGGTGSGQNRLPPSELTPAGPQGSSRSSAASQSPKYGDAHSTIAAPIMEGYLVKGQVPPTAQIRDELIAAYKQAGVQAPNQGDLTKRINASRPMLEAVKDAPPDVKARVLKALSESPGFLAVPAAVGVGGSLMSRSDRPTEIYLTPDGYPRQ